MVPIILVTVACSGARVAFSQGDDANPFDYDTRTPLDVREVGVEKLRGASVYDISYVSPKGGRVPAYLVVPDGKGPFAAVEFVHWGQGDRTEFLNEALLYAKSGAASLLIDAPFNRPDYEQTPLMADPKKDRAMYIQLVVDMRRGLDLLLSRSDIDRKRVAFIGHSLGATWGGALAGVDKRVRAFVLMGGLPNVTFSGDDAFSKAIRQKYSQEQIQRYAQVIGPINPENFVGRAAPAKLYFQFARWDRYISQASAERYEKAAPQPKTSRTYDTSHEFNDSQSWCDRIRWIQKELALANLAARASCEPDEAAPREHASAESAPRSGTSTPLLIQADLEQRQKEVADVERQGSSDAREHTAAEKGRLTTVQFSDLMHRISKGWNVGSAELALNAFRCDAVYMEPPDIQLYRGYSQLKPYFGAVTPGTEMLWHQLWFDESAQLGAGEFTFRKPNSSAATHGVVVVQLQDGQISFWREYQRSGPPEFADFVAVGNKQWKWTIENYPANQAGARPSSSSSPRVATKPEGSIADIKDQKAAVLQTMDELADAGMKRDVIRLAKIYSEDYFHTNADGSIMNRAEVLASYAAPPQATFKSNDRDEYCFQFSSGNTAVVSNRVTLKGVRNNASQFTSRFRTTTMLVKMAGTWRVVNSHASFLGEDDHN